MRLRLVEDFIFHNENPDGERITDCVIRALAFAYDMGYDRVKSKVKGKKFHNEVEFIEDQGYIDFKQEVEFPRDIDETVKDFCKDFREGTWVVRCGGQLDHNSIFPAIIGKGHLTVVKDGDIYDTWDCSRKKVVCAWGLNNE